MATNRCLLVKKLLLILVILATIVTLITIATLICCQLYALKHPKDKDLRKLKLVNSLSNEASVYECAKSYLYLIFALFAVLFQVDFGDIDADLCGSSICGSV